MNAFSIVCGCPVAMVFMMSGSFAARSCTTSAAAIAMNTRAIMLAFFRAQRRWTSGVVLVLAGVVQGQIIAVTAAPPVVRALDVRPDKGNNERHAFVSGPASPIARLYNEDLEIAFWNQPRTLTFNLAKNDVWDRRYFGDRKDLITLDDVRRVCFRVEIGDKKDVVYPGYGGLVGRNSDLGLPNSPQALYRAYDFPCPKPVGQVIIRCADLQDYDQYVVGETSDGAVVATAAKGKVRVTARGLLHKTRNLFVVSGEYAGLTRSVQIQFHRHQDTTPLDSSIPILIRRGGNTSYDYSQDRPHNGPLPPPEAGTAGRFFWIRQRFHPEKTFPKGFDYVMMGLIDGASYEVQIDNKAIDAGEQAVIHPVAPDAYRRLAGWLKQKRMAAERVNNAEYGALATATLKDVGTFTLFVAVVTSRDAADPLGAARRLLTEAQQTGSERIMQQSAVATDAQVRAWRNSRVMHYNATSCTYADATPWHGDYHFNEGYFLPTIVRGEADTLEQRLLMFEEMVPALQRNAREVYKCKGICFPLVHYPIKHDRVVYGNVTWEWGVENTALMLQPFWHIFQYSQDKEFLRKRAYPMMREGARFYADYVALGDDGCYHVTPTVSQEHWGFTPEWRLNRDSVGALSFVRYHLKACVQASEILGVDPEERARWGEIVEHLAPYPTLETEDGPVFCDVRDAPRLLNYNITANLVMVLWAEDISVDSPAELLETARRSYRALPDKAHSPRKGYLQRIRLYLGMLDKPWLCPQGRVLSWPGRIHLYAGVPKGFAVNDSFTGLLAVGGFEVSALHAGAEVRRVCIKSRVGGTCKMKSPWHPGEVRVIDREPLQTISHTMNRDTVVFQTKPAHTYAVLSPAEIRGAKLRFIAKTRTIGKWRFNKLRNRVVPDESGCGHDAQLMDGAELVPSRGGKALHLPGASSYARIERTPTFDFAANESFSLEARIKIVSAPDTQLIPIVCSMATRQYCLFLRRGCVRFYLSSPRGDVHSCVNGRTQVMDGQWHTIRAVRNVHTASLEIYVDDKLDGEAGDTTAGDFSANAPVAIGAYLYGDRTRYAQGLIDDVEIKSLGKLVERGSDAE